jgi:hypothetical protein
MRWLSKFFLAYRCSETKGLFLENATFLGEPLYDLHDVVPEPCSERISLVSI